MDSPKETVVVVDGVLDKNGLLFSSVTLFFVSAGNESNVKACY
jgi:hypothetical protein